MPRGNPVSSSGHKIHDRSQLPMAILVKLFRKDCHGRYRGSSDQRLLYTRLSENRINFTAASANHPPCRFNICDGGYKKREATQRKREVIVMEDGETYGM